MTDRKSMALAAVSLFSLRLGDQAIEDFVKDFCGLYEQVEFNDIALKDIFRFGLREDISHLMPHHTPSLNSSSVY